MSRRVWSVNLRPWSYTTATTMVLAFAPPLFADAYMDAIKGEAKKIDAGQAASATTPEGTDSVSQDPNATPFERELDQRYHGAYLFYQALPGPTRAEIVQAHDNGASMDEIRKKIMERFLLSQ